MVLAQCINLYGHMTSILSYIFQQGGAYRDSILLKDGLDLKNTARQQTIFVYPA